MKTDISVYIQFIFIRCVWKSSRLKMDVQDKIKTR